MAKTKPPSVPMISNAPRLKGFCTYGIETMGVIMNNYYPLCVVDDSVSTEKIKDALIRVAEKGPLICLVAGVHQLPKFRRVGDTDNVRVIVFDSVDRLDEVRCEVMDATKKADGSGWSVKHRMMVKHVLGFVRKIVGDSAPPTSVYPASVKIPVPTTPEKRETGIQKRGPGRPPKKRPSANVEEMLQKHLKKQPDNLSWKKIDGAIQDVTRNVKAGSRTDAAVRIITRDACRRMLGQIDKDAWQSIADRAITSGAGADTVHTLTGVITSVGRMLVSFPDGSKVPTWVSELRKELTSKTEASATQPAKTGK